MKKKATKRKTVNRTKQQPCNPFPLPSSMALFTLHSSLFTLHCSLFTVHSSLFTLHSSLFTLHSSLFTLHTTLDTRHCFTRLPHPPMNDPHEPPTTTCNIDVPLVKAYYTIHSSLRRGVAAAGRARAGGGSPGQGAD